MVTFYTNERHIIKSYQYETLGKIATLNFHEYYPQEMLLLMEANN